jgi:succinoglycan biosynthesis transport protein ExoP
VNPLPTLLAIRARYKLILFTVLLTVITAIAVSLLLPKTYKATTTLVLNYKGVDPVTGHSLSGNLMPGYLATQIDILNSKALVMQVIERMKLAENARIHAIYESNQRQVGIQEWLSETIGDNLDVTPSRQSSVLEISYSDADPQMAAAMANAFAEQYRETASKVNSEPQMRLSNYFEDQAQVLRGRLEEAHRRLSDYQKENELVSVDSRYDIESKRLSELSSQLVVVQGQLQEAQSREAQVRQAGGTNSAEVVNDPLIQSLKTALAQAEAKRSQLAVRFTPAHPEYVRAAAEVTQLRAAIQANTRATLDSVRSTALMLAQREKALRAALDEQRAKVLQANQTRDQLTVLSGEVESARRAYDDLMQRFNQARIDGQANQSDVAILAAARVPERPAFPRLSLNVAIALVLGTLLGLCLALVAEFMDRRVRSARELTDILNAPVLGTLQLGTRVGRIESRGQNPHEQQALLTS